MKKFRIVEKIDNKNISEFFPEVSFDDGNEWISFLPDAEQRFGIGDRNIDIAKGRIDLYKAACAYIESGRPLHPKLDIVETKIHKID